MRIIAELFLFITRHYPFKRGRHFLMRHFEGGIRQMSASAPCDLQTRCGFRILTDTRPDFVSLMIRLWGEYETETQAFLVSHLHDGDVFLDIGANVGYFSLCVGHLKRASSILAFEPNQPLASLLEGSAYLNGYSSRLSVHRLAVSNYTGTIKFAVNQVNTGESKVVLNDANLEATISVPCVAMDEWFPVQRIEKRIGLIKMDIEGAEPLALEGMKKLLQLHKPILIIEGYERNLITFGSSLGQLRSLLQSIGYREIAPYDGNLYLAMEGI